MTNLTAKQVIAEATRRQNNAAHVSQSVWVSASAGTGKTYVLTKRILQLLLEDKLLQPSGILAVTFTRAAAREMESRIRERLSVWATCSEESLVEELSKMLEGQPTALDIRRARTLFADVLDDGVNSNTIHGFCQQILAKFPIEAGVSPGFKLVEGRERDDLLACAKNDIFAQALNGELNPNWIFDHYAGEMGEKSLSEALDAFVGSAGRFRRYFKNYGGVEGALCRLADVLNVTPNLSIEMAQKQVGELCVLPERHQAQVKKIMEALFAGGKQAQGHATQLTVYLNEGLNWDVLTSVFLTAKGEKRSKLLDKKAQDFGGDYLIEDIDEITYFILNAQEKMKAISAYLITSSYLHLGHSILERYEHLKQKAGALDFDDLIAKSAALLSSDEKSAWVRFKMDSRISHVLLDEAQDTDSEQWGILKALVEEFYAGKGLHEEKKRTFFAVGDIKQSIYRFRGAEPHVFGSMRDYLKAHQQGAGHKVAVEELIVSFRSTEPVLNFVDCIFKDPTRGKAVDELVDTIDHRAAKIGSSGRIEIWPLIEKEKVDKEEQEPWALPSRNEKASTVKTQLAEKVALHIQQLLSSNDVLESTNQYIVPSDIMILLRSRTMMSTLIAALDKYRIPHAGADQMDMHKESAVLDVMALVKALMNREDDLSLAQVLRSPLFSYKDVQFDDFAGKRQKSQSLWQILDKETGAGLALLGLKKQIRKMTPFAFLSHVIQTLDVRGKYYKLAAKDAGQTTIASVDDALDALQDLALNYQKQGGSLIGFIHHFENTKQKLKRELESGGGRVRLLTAHGSKGLESPIVIMPDTTGGFYRNMSGDKPLWQTESDGADTLFLHRQSKVESPAVQTVFEDEEKERIFRDEMRLLYVAVTRAKERLYIGGVKQHGYNAENCWYGHIYAAVEEADDFEKDSHGVLFKDVSNHLTASAQEESLAALESNMPDWMYQNAQAEKGVVLMNASDSLKRKEQLSFLKESDNKKLFKRGKLVHRLLEVLPTYTPQERQEKGLRYLKLAGSDFTQDEQLNMLESALGVMSTYPLMFAVENSRAEVPLSALDGHKRLEGVVDRLVVYENEVIAIDFKTNKNVPNAVPVDYVLQLAHYKKALEIIFPKKFIKTCIIWTSPKIPKVDWL
tara:strand:+ start:40370 stop:43768 length:3399 start_codon:yes stop_codon:yes gene_type:complete